MFFLKWALGVHFILKYLHLYRLFSHGAARHETEINTHIYYKHTHTHTHTHTHVHALHTHTHTHASTTHTHTHTHTHTYMHYTHTHTHTCMHALHTHTHTCMHYTHKHTHTHTHRQSVTITQLTLPGESVKAVSRRLEKTGPGHTMVTSMFCSWPSTRSTSYQPWNIILLLVKQAVLEYQVVSSKHMGSTV